MSQKIYQVDAFTNTPFAGNPAAVCLLDAPADVAWMQSVAMEMSLSETAFLHPEADGYRLRWFTPKKEVRLCGHATLASAHVLWENGVLPAGSQARFYTLSGLLTAEKNGDWIEMDFPARFHAPCMPPDGLLEALGATVMSVHGREDVYLIELEDEAAVRELEPDFGLLGRLPVRSVMVTACSADPKYDFISRYFAPAVGVNEDPVTGSAHCALAPFWSARLGGKQEMLAYQASARGGELRVRLAGERVILCGQAVTVMAGELIDAPQQVEIPSER